MTPLLVLSKACSGKNPVPTLQPATLKEADTRLSRWKVVVVRRRQKAAKPSFSAGCPTVQKSAATTAKTRAAPTATNKSSPSKSG